MSSLIFLKHIAFATGVLALTVVLIVAIASAILLGQFSASEDSDISSAKVPPFLRTGGIAIIVAYLTGIFLIQILGEFTPIKFHYFWGFLGASILLAVTSFYSSFKSLDIKLNLAGQVLAALIVMYSGIVISEIRLPWVGLVAGGWWVYPMTLLWILGLTNVYATMEKVDGLATSAAVIASGFFCFITFQQGSAFIYLCSVTLFAVSIGFLAFNWPPSKIYLGQLGATFLGFSFAVMGIIAALYDSVHSSLFTIPLLLFHFIFEAVFYFGSLLRSGRRVGDGQGIQLCHLLGKLNYSDRTIVLFYSGVGVAQGIGAILMINIGNGRMWVFLPFLLFQIAYASWLLHRSKRFGPSRVSV